MEARLTKVEGAVDLFKVVFALFTAVLIGGFGFLGGQLMRVDAHLARVDDHLARLDGQLTQIDGRLARVDDHLARLDGSVSALATDMQTLPDKINANLQTLTRTLADAITAAKQVPPQVVLLPASPVSASAPPPRNAD